MLNFKPINNEDLSLFAEFFSLQDHKLCDYSVGAVYMWKDFFSSEYTVFDDFLVFQAKYYDVEKNFSYPISIKDNSPGNIKKAIKTLEDYSKSQNYKTVNYNNVPKEGIVLLEEIYGRRLVKEFDRDWCDYLYNFEDIRTFKGRKYNGQRNHINQFARNYPHYKFQAITKENIEKLIKFFEEFLKTDLAGDEIEQNELDMTTKLLQEYFSLPMTGGILEIGDKIAGFTIGEIVNRTLFVHIEKAYTEYKGIYPFIAKQFAQLNSDKNILYINREEDVGDPGLRRAKMSYHPCELLEKYTAEISI